MGEYIVHSTDTTGFQRCVEAGSAQEAVEENLTAISRKAHGRYRVGPPAFPGADVPLPGVPTFGELDAALEHHDEGLVVWDAKEQRRVDTETTGDS